MTYDVFPVVDLETNEIAQRFADATSAIVFCGDARKFKIAFDQMDAAVWHNREKMRFEQKEYRPLPDYLTTAISKFQVPETDGHFAHISSDFEGIAFTANHEHGVIDRQTVLKPGRYLQRFYAKFLSENQIRELASLFASVKSEQYEVLLGYTREDFRRVYLGGNVVNPSSRIYSCMGKAFPSLPCHPCEVYAAGDLAIAYILDPKDKNVVIARAIVFPENKTRSYAYGKDHETKTILDSKLEKMGYTHRVPFFGAKLLKIPYPDAGKNHYMMPHIDSNDPFMDHPTSPDHFLIDKKGRNYATPLDGYLRVI